MSYKYITEQEAEARYCEMLDEVYPEVTIGSISFDPSRVLKELDPTAFRCGLADWLDSEGLTTDKDEDDEDEDDEDEDGEDEDDEEGAY